MRYLPIFVLAATIGCGAEGPAPEETTSTSAELDRANPNPMLYRKDAHPLMFKPMSPGQHTIVIHGHDMQGVPVTLTQHLTIR